MNEIEFFGSKTEGDSSIGALAKAWFSVISNKEKIMNYGNSVRVPYVHFLKPEEAEDVNSKSFSWPIRVWVSSGDNIYAPSNYCKDSASFRKLVEESKYLKDVCFVVTRQPPQWYGNSFEKKFFFIGHDTALIQSDGEPIMHLNGDFRDILTSFGVEHSHMVRLIKVGPSWVIDGFLDASSKEVANITGKSIKDLDENLLYEFKMGFLNAFNSTEAEGSSCLNLCSERPISMTQFKIPNEPKAARCSGAMVGFLMQSRKNAVFHKFFKGEDVTTEGMIKLMLSYDSLITDQYKSFSKVHNSIVDGTPSDIEENLVSYFSPVKSSGSWNYLALHFEGFASHLDTSSKYSSSSNEYDNYSKTLNEDMNISFTISQVFTAENFQFRITNFNSHSENSNIRMQIPKGFNASKFAKLDDGSIITVAEYEGSGIEIDFQIPGKIKKLNEIKYDKKSTAGTDAKYASLMVKDGNIVTVEKEIVLCSVDFMLSKLSWLK